MDTWQIALLVSATAFAAFMVFKMRPVGERARTTAATLKEARLRISAAKDDAARVKALCDAGDACAGLARTGAAVSFYLRALQVEPLSGETVRRAAASLSGRPAALEKLLWRALGGAPWTGPRREAATAALTALAAIYDRRPRTQPRGRAVLHMIEVMASSAGPGSPRLRGDEPGSS